MVLSIKGQKLPCTIKLSSCLQFWVSFIISLKIKGKRKTPAELLIGWGNNSLFIPLFQ